MSALMAINPYSKMNTNTRAPILYGSNAHEFISRLPSRKWPWEVGGVDLFTSEVLIFIVLWFIPESSIAKPLVIVNMCIQWVWTSNGVSPEEL
jgi:hypothetical protein